MVNFNCNPKTTWQLRRCPRRLTHTWALVTNSARSKNCRVNLLTMPRLCCSTCQIYRSTLPQCVIEDIYPTFLPIALKHFVMLLLHRSWAVWPYLSDCLRWHSSFSNVSRKAQQRFHNHDALRVELWIVTWSFLKNPTIMFTWRRCMQCTNSAFRLHRQFNIKKKTLQNLMMTALNFLNKHVPEIYLRHRYYIFCDENGINVARISKYCLKI